MDRAGLELCALLCIVIVIVMALQLTCADKTAR